VSRIRAGQRVIVTREGDNRYQQTGIALDFKFVDHPKWPKTWVRVRFDDGDEVNIERRYLRKSENAALDAALSAIFGESL
jgi:hypothetical protein